MQNRIEKGTDLHRRGPWCCCAMRHLKREGRQSARPVKFVWHLPAGKASAPGQQSRVPFVRKLTERSLQCVGNLPQPAHCRIDDPSLDPADVCSVEAALAAKTLLRVARPLTELAHNRTDSSHPQIGRLDLLRAPLHQQIR